MYWNHNTAYYKWIGKKVANCRRILDVGCGIGTLAGYLCEQGRQVIGIDSSESCINRANETWKNRNLQFRHQSFDDFTDEKGSFDAVIFVASIHHMDMAEALRKARDLLEEGGMIIIVGLARSSSLLDKIIDILRVVPAFIGSILHRMKTSEDKDIPVSYEFPEMDEVRRVLSEQLGKTKIRYGLYWRYLMIWKKE